MLLQCSRGAQHFPPLSPVFAPLCAQILVGELCAFFTKAEGAQEKTIVTADCCYFNPLLRRIIRFLGEHTVLYHTAPLCSLTVFLGRGFVSMCGFVGGMCEKDVRERDQNYMKEKVEL